MEEHPQEIRELKQRIDEIETRKLYREKELN